MYKINNLNERIEWAINGKINGQLIKNLPNKQFIEKEWGQKIMNTNSPCWSAQLGEQLVYDVLKSKDINVWKPKNCLGYQPDLETQNSVIEVKCRNYTTSGTIGEKVLGTPFKYAEIQRIYNKKLYIICVGYQEYELTDGNSNIAIFNTHVPERKEILKFWKKQKIFFIPFSELIKFKNK